MTNLFKILLKLDGCQKNIMCRNCKKAKAYTNIKFLLALRTSGLWEGSTGRPIWGKFGVTLCYNHLQYTCTNSSLLRHVYIQRTSRSIAGQQQEVKYLNLLLLFLLFPWTRRHNAHTHCIDVIHICSKSFCSEFFVFGKKFVWHSNILILIFVWQFFIIIWCKFLLELCMVLRCHCLSDSSESASTMDETRGGDQPPHRPLPWYKMKVWNVPIPIKIAYWILH